MYVYVGLAVSMKLETQETNASLETVTDTVDCMCFLLCRYSREEPFTALNIEIRNQQHLFESLDAFVKGDLLEGANAYHCEKCDKKVSSCVFPQLHEHCFRHG